MKRLIKRAESMEDAKILLNRIDEASDNLKDVYYVLFDNLNALFEAYPNLYKQMQMVIKLPTNEDAGDVVRFHEDLHSVLEHFKDEQYLMTYIEPAKPQNEELEMPGKTPTLPE